MYKHLLLSASLMAVCAMPVVAEVEEWTVNGNTWQVERTEKDLCPGVKYTLVDWKTNRSTARPGSRLHVIEADLSNPKISVENVKTPGQMTGNKTLVDFAKQVHSSKHQVVAGANGNFWSTSGEGALFKSYGSRNQPHGVCISDGVMYTDANIGPVAHCGGPITRTGLLAIDDEGNAYLDYLKPQILIPGTQVSQNDPGSGTQLACVNTSIGHRLQMEMVNRFVSYNCSSIFTPEYGRDRQFNVGDLGADFVKNIGAPGTTGGNDGYIEILLDYEEGTTEMNIGGITKFVVSEIRYYPKGETATIGTIGDHDLAIVGRNLFAYVPGVNWKVGHKVDFDTQLNFVDHGTPARIMQAISGNVLAMKNGVIESTVSSESYNTSIYPRTTYGLSADRKKLYIIVCEHNVTKNGQKVYQGFSLPDICVMARDKFGVNNLTQLDCGGSAQMYANGEQVAASYDANGRRAVYNGLYICYNDDDVKLNEPGTNEPEPDKDPDEGWVDSGERAHFAYGLYTSANGEVPTVNYSLTGDVKSVDIILTNKDNENDVVTIAGGIAKGLNSVPVNDAALTQGASYNWKVKVYSKPVSGTSHFMHDAPATLDARGGVGVVTNPESSAYGKIITSMGYAQGFGLYSPDLTKEGVYHAETSPWSVSHHSDIYRIAMRGNSVAYACARSDAGSGYWKFDPESPETAPSNLAGGENDGTGCFKVPGSDTCVGSNATGIGIQTGDNGEESIWVFAADWPSGNSSYKGILCRWMLDGDKQITWGVRAATEELAGTGKFANQNVSITPTHNGVFCAQLRGKGNNSMNVPGFVYVNEKFEIVYSSGTEPGKYNSCGGSVAISDDMSTFAVAGYGENIKVFDVTWVDNVPSFTFRAYVNDTKHVNEVSQMAFDPAGNLYVWQRSADGNYSGLFGYSWKNDAPEAVTPAKAADVIVVGQSSGIDDVVIDSENASTVYYTVQGVRVDASALTPGLYIKVQGNMSTKVVIK